ncbi:MAG: AI-2E family transporter [Cyclobacteriaceae bacterium]|jgi:predicted PurR-regulated permease PerM|nr:AI-2E family transporter [Flammeovirgaceae bacterium]
MKSLKTKILYQQILLFFLMVVGVYYAKPLLVPICISGILATLFLPFCRWLENKKMKRGLAVSICFALFIVGIFSILSLIGWQIGSVVKDLPLLKEKIASTLADSQAYILAHVGLSFESQSELLKSEQHNLSGLITGMVSSLSSLFANIILVIAYTFLILYYRSHLFQFVIRLFKSSHREEATHVIQKITNISQQYLVGLGKIIVCLWILYGIGFSVLGVKNALLFALVCGMLEIIPFIGNITGTALTVLVAGVNGANLSLLGGIIVIYGVIQFVQGWFLEPLILGPQVKINPFFTIVALIIGNLLWGIAGIVLAIPLAAIGKIICDHVESLKPYGFLIGEVVWKKSPPHDQPTE